MADKTQNYNLTKPLESEFYDVKVQNDNMDKIDGALKDQADEIKGLQDGQKKKADLDASGRVPLEQLPDIDAAQVGAVPATRTVNGKALSADISLNAAAVGAVPGNFTVDGVQIGISGTMVSRHLCDCATTAATAAKVVSLTGFKLVTGARIEVQFTYSNTAVSPTLNVNNTGARPIKKYGTTAADTYMWAAGAVVGFVYDGMNWIMLGGTTASTTYYGVTKLSSSVSSTSATEAATPSAVKTAYDKANAALPKSGGTMTGALYAYNDTSYTTSKVRNISLETGTTSPALTNGTIRLVYE